MIGGSIIVNPDGEIVVEAKTEDDELLVHACDLDATVFGKTDDFRLRATPAHRALWTDHQPHRRDPAALDDEEIRVSARRTAPHRAPW